MIEKIEKIVYFLIFLSLPTQLGKHFWPDFSKVNGIRLDYLSPTLYLTDILIIILAAFFLYQNLPKFIRVSKKLPFKKKHVFLYSNSNNSDTQSSLQISRPFVYLLIALLLTFSYNAIFSVSPQAALYGTLKIIEFIFFAFYIARENIAITKKFLTRALFINIPFISILGFLQVLSQSSIGSIFYYLGERTFTVGTPGIATILINGEPFLRPYSTFSHPNVLAFFLLFSLVFLFEIEKRKDLLINLYTKTLKVIITALLFLTFSKIVSFLALIYLITKIYKNIKIKAAALIIIGLIIILSTFFILQFYSLERIQNEIQMRIELINIGYNIWQTSPFFGVGPKNFFYHEIEYQKNFSVILLQPIHNIFILTLIEMGIVGLAVLVSLLILTLKKLIHNHFESPSLDLVRLSTILVIALSVTGLVDHYFLTLQQGQLMFAIILGLSWSTQHSKI